MATIRVNKGRKTRTPSTPPTEDVGEAPAGPVRPARFALLLHELYLLVGALRGEGLDGSQAAWASLYDPLQYTGIKYDVSLWVDQGVAGNKPELVFTFDYRPRLDDVVNWWEQEMATRGFRFDRVRLLVEYESLLRHYRDCEALFEMVKFYHYRLGRAAPPWVEKTNTRYWCRYCLARHDEMKAEEGADLLTILEEDVRASELELVMRRKALELARARRE